MREFEEMNEGQVTGEQVTEAPMTEEPVAEAPVQEEPVAEAPMTEEPVAEAPVQEETVAEAPMAETPAEASMPEVTVEEAPVAEAPVMGEAMETVSRDLPMPKEKKNKTFIIAAGIIGVALVAIVVIAVALFSGVFANKGDKVLLAISNTFDESSQMVEEYTKMSEFLLDSYTMGMEVEVEGNYIEFQYAMTDDEKQISGSVSVEDVPEIDFLAAFTDSQLKAQVPSLTDYVFTYDYTAEKSGYLVDTMGEETISLLDSMCEMIYSADEATGNAEVFAESLIKEYESLEFENAEKREYDVDGTSRECTAYKTTITEENWLNMIDALEEFYSMDYLDAMAEMGADMGEVFDEMRDELVGMPDIDVVFYIYKNKLACMSLAVDGEEVEFLFNNGDDGMLDIEVWAGTELLMELNGSVDGSVESYEFIVEDSASPMMMAFTYDTENSDFAMTMEDEYDTITMSGSMYSDSESAVFEFTEVEMYGETMEMLCSITVEKGAELQEIEGEEIDLGNATEEELMDVVMEIYSAMN